MSLNSHDQSSTDAGNWGSVISPTSRPCSSSRRGWPAQSSKSPGDPTTATPRTRSSSAATDTASAPPVPNPASQMPSGRTAPATWEMALAMSSSHPAAENWPSDSAQPR